MKYLKNFLSFGRKLHGTWVGLPWSWGSSNMRDLSRGLPQNANCKRSFKT